ncbi:MAG: hypothetical protein AAGU21_12010 [Solidesulfovibrio sp.]|uniref:hypothetical protein n=1 Tax=Solidesulfovibrio sp. TaxID=2910990 RepID=UPI003158696E
MVKKDSNKAESLRDKDADFHEEHLSRNKILEYLRAYKKEKGDPSDFNGALLLVRSCIEFYRDHFMNLIQSGPYKKIHGLALERNIEKKFDFRDESIETCSDFSTKAWSYFYGLVSKEFESGGDAKSVEYVKENLNRYLEILSAINMVKVGESSSIAPSFIKSLYVLMYLSFTDLDLYGYFFQTDEVTKLIHSAISARGQNKRWKTTKELNSKAVEIIYELWEKGDKRLHDKISKDVVGKMNDKILLPIKKKLLKKYPNKDLDSEVMENYKQELSYLSRGKLANSRTVMRMVFEHALDKKKANDPQKSARKWKREVKK